MNRGEIKFWAERPSDLFAEWTLTLNPSMSTAKRSNCLTRVLIIFVILLLLFKVEYWWAVLLVGIILIIAIYIGESWSGEETVEHYVCARKEKKGKISIRPRQYKNYR